MDMTAIAGMAWNTGVTTVAVYFVKRWMDNVDGAIKVNAQDRKESIAMLSNQLNGVYEQLRAVNGRTGQLETEIAVIHEVCRERHEKK